MSKHESTQCSSCPRLIALQNDALDYQRRINRADLMLEALERNPEILTGLAERALDQLCSHVPDDPDAELAYLTSPLPLDNPEPPIMSIKTAEMCAKERADELALRVERIATARTLCGILGACSLVTPGTNDAPAREDH